MADFAERIYDLAAEALAEQERQVSELRGRGATLLAAGAVVTSLLATPVFHGDHPHGVAEVTATAGGLLGAAGLLVFVVLLLRPYELGFSIKTGAPTERSGIRTFLTNRWSTSRSRTRSRTAEQRTPRRSNGS